jgi:hypothetical protein
MLDAGSPLDLKPIRKPLATISTKRCIDTVRVYQPGFAVYITLDGKKEKAHGVT